MPPTSPKRRTKIPKKKVEHVLQMPSDQYTMSTLEAGAALGVPKKKILEWVREGKLEGFQLPGKVGPGGRGKVPPFRILIKSIDAMKVKPVALPKPGHAMTTINRDLSRYYRFMAGESDSDIATRDNVTIEEVQKSIHLGEVQEEARQRSALMKLRYEAALANETLRKRARNKLEDKFLGGLGKLLKGQRVVVERDLATGKVTFHEYEDPDVIVKGVEQYRKTTSLEEKPVQVLHPSMTVNVQNNQAQPIGGRSFGGGSRETFEEKLRRIRQGQRDTGDVIDGELQDSETVLPAVEAVQEAEEVLVGVAPSKPRPAAKPAKGSSPWEF